MIFDFITDTAEALVNATCDTAEALIGEGEGPTRSDVAQLLSAGMTVGAIAVAFNVTEDAVQALLDD